MSDQDDFNTQVIEEFRANNGVVGGFFEGKPLLIVHTVGAKSGKERLIPLVYQQLDNGWAIFGSKGGAPGHPDWYFNLQAQSDVSIEVGLETVEVSSRVAEGDERETIWSAQKDAMPMFADYEASAGDREIPVIVLERR